MNDDTAREKRVTDAIRAAAEAGEMITVSTIARAANVSRPWLYRRDHLLAQIQAHTLDDDEKLNYSNTFQVTGRELRVIDLAAKKAGMPRAAYERAAVVAQAARDLGLEPEDLDTPRRQAPRRRNRERQQREDEQS
jgi:hypothetical protein